MYGDWQRLLGQNWANLRFGEIKIKTTQQLHLFEIQVFFSGLAPDAVLIELYAEGLNEF
jgi:hypothetical protein